jgi:hypothetical protein
MIYAHGVGKGEGCIFPEPHAPVLVCPLGLIQHQKSSWPVTLGRATGWLWTCGASALYCTYCKWKAPSPRPHTYTHSASCTPPHHPAPSPCTITLPLNDPLSLCGRLPFGDSEEDPLDNRIKEVGFV